MSGERFLVTGALGCVGAWTVRALVREGVPVTTFDLGGDPRRLRQIMTPDELATVDIVAGDITDLDGLSAVLEDRAIDHVIHLAALQVPFCRADPPLGARVNVLGTINVFEAVRRRARSVPMAPISYTSSIGMYSGDDADAATGRLAVDATAHPQSHYGVYKLANEGSARVYWLEDGIASVGVRPLTVYGVGRDQGMTSGPTKAIAAAVLGTSFTVPFRGATLFQYARDVAATLIAASRADPTGAHVYNLPGTIADGSALLAAIEAAVPGAADLVRFEPVDLPFPTEIDSDGIETLGPIPVTSLADGVRESVDIYRSLARSGRLDPAEQGLEPVPAA
ncbi:MAG: NAD-dependent epimerase/dehydratase family protein [Chloroflexota bacterium]